MCAPKLTPVSIQEHRSQYHSDFAIVLQGCAELSAVSGMAIAYSDAQMVGSVATYSCTAAGYVPSGDATRTCLADGSWEGTAPTCIVRHQLFVVMR